MAGIYNFKTQTAGDTFNGLSFTATLNDVAIDLNTVSGIKLTFKTENGETTTATYTVGSGITVDDASAGQFSLDSFTVFAEGTYIYDLEFTYSSGVVKTYMKGIMKVLKQIS